MLQINPATGGIVWFTCDHAITLIEQFRPEPHGSLLGFARVRFRSGVIVDRVTIHAAGSKAWAGAPGAPWIGKDGQLVRDERGKIQYSPVIRFADHGVRSRWSDEVIEAMRRQYPDVLPHEPTSDELEGQEAIRWFEVQGRGRT